jgi:hypothetical protein
MVLNEIKKDKLKTANSKNSHPPFCVSFESGERQLGWWSLLVSVGWKVMMILMGEQLN